MLPGKRTEQALQNLARLIAGERVVARPSLEQTQPALVVAQGGDLHLEVIQLLWQVHARQRFNGLVVNDSVSFGASSGQRLRLIWQWSTKGI